MLAAGKADIMLSGGRTQFIALKAKTPWLDINQERIHPYAGYDGMVELVRQIDLAIHNPSGRRCARRRPGTRRRRALDARDSPRARVDVARTSRETASSLTVTSQRNSPRPSGGSDTRASAERGATMASDPEPIVTVSRPRASIR